MQGGAVYVATALRLTVTNSTFASNLAGAEAGSVGAGIAGSVGGGALSASQCSDVWVSGGWLGCSLNANGGK